LTVQVENSLPDKLSATPNAPSGIGLANIRKRLVLLYPDHELRIHEKETYLVYLKIKKQWFGA
jgi:sensor histidine kinase YesM